MFKKIFISAAVIITFIVYVLFQRPPASRATFVVSPTNDIVQPVSNPISLKNDVPAAPSNNLKTFNDGTYIGKSVDAYYGNVQVKAVIHGGQLVDVQFMSSPMGRSTSMMINNYAMPMLMTEAIKAQNSQVDIISGATFTSQAFRQSLGDALSQAKL
jgi:uncharacterized protein with FMN-binding domain